MLIVCWVRSLHPGPTCRKRPQPRQITCSVQSATLLLNPRWLLQMISDQVVFCKINPKCGGFLQFTPGNLVHKSFFVTATSKSFFCCCCNQHSPMLLGVRSMIWHANLMQYRYYGICSLTGPGTLGFENHSEICTYAWRCVEVVSFQLKLSRRSLKKAVS